MPLYHKMQVYTSVPKIIFNWDENLIESSQSPPKPPNKTSKIPFLLCNNPSGWRSQPLNCRRNKLTLYYNICYSAMERKGRKAKNKGLFWRRAGGWRVQRVQRWGCVFFTTALCFSYRVPFFPFYCSEGSCSSVRSAVIIGKVLLNPLLLSTRICSVW